MTRPDPDRLDLFAARLVTAGLWVAVALIALGSVLTFVHHPGAVLSPVDLGALRAEGMPRGTREVLAGLTHLRGRAFTLAGVGLLITLPVLRVVISAAGFARAGDRRLLAVAGLVLALLGLGAALGLTA